VNVTFTKQLCNV